METLNQQPSDELRYVRHDPEPSTEEIVKRLNSRKVAERKAAEESLQQLGPEAVESLLALIRAESAKRKKRQRCIVIGISAFVVFMIVLSRVSEVFAPTPPLAGRGLPVSPARLGCLDAGP